jgi:hypothetical protein
MTCKLFCTFYLKTDKIFCLILIYQMQVQQIDMVIVLLSLGIFIYEMQVIRYSSTRCRLSGFMVPNATWRSYFGQQDNRLTELTWFAPNWLLLCSFPFCWCTIFLLNYNASSHITLLDVNSGSFPMSFEPRFICSQILSVPFPSTKSTYAGKMLLYILSKWMIWFLLPVCSCNTYAVKNIRTCHTLFCPLIMCCNGHICWCFDIWFHIFRQTEVSHHLKRSSNLVQEES